MHANPRYLAIGIPPGPGLGLNTNLWAALSAIDPDTPRDAQYLRISPVDAALWIGNSDMLNDESSGTLVLDTEIHEIQSLASNLLRLDQIWLLSNGTNPKNYVTVAIVTR